MTIDCNTEINPAMVKLHQANGSFGNFAQVLKDEDNRSQNKTARQAISGFAIQYLQK
jgi:hypothetical protein